MEIEPVTFEPCYDAPSADLNRGRREGDKESIRERKCVVKDMNNFVV